MRIWDIHPGYLSRHNLLGEHTQLHGLVSIVRRGKADDFQHPEVQRWNRRSWALKQHHNQLVAEMKFRGHRHQSPLRYRIAQGQWPETFVDQPSVQFDLLKRQSVDPERAARIPVPRTSHELWAHHKYSVMARNQSAYREIGRRVSQLRERDGFDELALELIGWMRQPPTDGNLRNAIGHMWGYLSSSGTSPAFDRLSPKSALNMLQRLGRLEKADYLLKQTALTDLAAWL